eukprot:TRINITY_DN2885_c0_g1_i1.p1 TRINITY_DN2885_c0_g1~~TRINITY_DN2885_c0_g1_i1.p1  ORF type:complete len:667 (-),score=132.12 TRINITY_DN2885_c0_g1_i1:289-2289(-)
MAAAAALGSPVAPTFPIRSRAVAALAALLPEAYAATSAFDLISRLVDGLGKDEREALRLFEAEGQKVLSVLSTGALASLLHVAAALASAISSLSSSGSASAPVASSTATAAGTAAIVKMSDPSASECNRGEDDGRGYIDISGMDCCSGSVSSDGASTGSETEDQPSRNATELGVVSHGASDQSVGNLVQSSSMRGVRLTFDQFDTDKDGRLSLDEFQVALVELGLYEQFSRDEVTALLDAADIDGDGFVGLEDFTSWLYAAQPTGAAAPVAGEDDGVIGEVEYNLRRQLCLLREENNKMEGRLCEIMKKHEREVKRLEECHELEVDSILQFWRETAKTSSSPQLGSFVDIEAFDLLGNGRYGFVFKTKLVQEGGSDTKEGVPVVVKLMNVRWAHVAAKEWRAAQLVGDCPHILGPMQEVVLHQDVDKKISKLLKAARSSGRLQGCHRAYFPDRYLCMFQEYMNRGTVQNWMDDGRLSPGGVFVVMQRVASALAFMHRHGLTHNDVKPENFLLCQANGKDPRVDVSVKLADLGLASGSVSDRTADFTQYGMSVLCMTVRERFGTRKFHEDEIDTWANEIAATASSYETGGGRVQRVLRELPDWLRKIWRREVSMAEVASWRKLHSWGFFDGGSSSPTAESHGEGTSSRAVEVGISSDVFTRNVSAAC